MKLAPGTRSLSLKMIAALCLSVVEFKVDTRIVITEGGTYSGSWRSADPLMPAITVKTSQPVIIKDCHVQGYGTLISIETTGADVVVKGCVGLGQLPEMPDLARPRFLTARMPKRLVVEANFVELTRGVRIDRIAESGSAGIIVRNNEFLNINGACRSRCSWALNGNWLSGVGDAGANFLQLVDITDANIDIEWNQVVNERGLSAVEDNINLYNVVGARGCEVRVAHNMIVGAFPGRWSQEVAYSGSGIVLDGDHHSSSSSTSWVSVIENTVLRSENAGIGVAAGHNNSVVGNVLARAPIPEDPRSVSNPIGIYVWLCCKDEHPEWQETFFSNSAFDNIAGVAKGDTKGEPKRNDYWFPSCESSCLKNAEFSEPVDVRLELNLIDNWKRTLAAHKVQDLNDAYGGNSKRCEG